MFSLITSVVALLYLLGLLIFIHLWANMLTALEWRGKTLLVKTPPSGWYRQDPFGHHIWCDHPLSSSWINLTIYSLLQYPISLWTSHSDLYQCLLWIHNNSWQPMLLWLGFRRCWGASCSTSIQKGNSFLLMLHYHRRFWLDPLWAHQTFWTYSTETILAI